MLLLTVWKPSRCNPLDFIIPGAGWVEGKNPSCNQRNSAILRRNTLNFKCSPQIKGWYRHGVVIHLASLAFCTIHDYISIPHKDLSSQLASEQTLSVHVEEAVRAHGNSRTAGANEPFHSQMPWSSLFDV